MRLPWKKQQRIEELQDRIESLEEEKQELEKRFKREKERRSRLASEKQEAQEELNRLKDKIRSLEDDNGEEEEKQELEREELGFDRAYRILEKLASIESPEDDLVTVFSPGKVQEVEDLRGLKNAVNLEQLEFLREARSFVAFLDQDFFQLALKTRPFFSGEWELGDGFEVSPVIDFIEGEKVWALVSAGETRIFREKAGEVEELETVKSRVDRQHGKGGFSQDRFERKRDEQVQQHLEEVEEALEGLENVYLLGERSLCQQLPGEYLGGFDPNASGPEQFYQFQLLKN